MAEWRVQLTGEKFDLEYAAEYFRVPELTVKREADDFYFSSNQWDTFPQAEYEIVHSLGKECLVRINALAKLRFRNFLPLKWAVWLI